MKTTRSSLLLVLSLFVPQLTSIARAEDSRGAPNEKGPSEAGMLAVQEGDSEFERDIRGQGYVFGGVGSMSNVGSVLYEFGGGYDWIFSNGLGLGGEVSLLGDQSTGIATGGVRLSYHFLPSSPGIEPFAVGGMSFGGAAEYGLSGYTWATAGGGFNYWFHNGMALRVEALGRLDVEYSDHMAVLRVGLTF